MTYDPSNERAVPMKKLLAVAGLVVLAGCGSTVKSGGLTATTEGPAEPVAVVSTTTTAAAHVPVPEDFMIEVIELSRSCFGSAGCNITYRISPTYVGPTIADKGQSYTVVYDVLGGESTKTDNFTISFKNSQVKSEDFISTPSGAVLSAVATRVLPN